MCFPMRFYLRKVMCSNEILTQQGHVCSNEILIQKGLECSNDILTQKGHECSNEILTQKGHVSYLVSNKVLCVLSCIQQSVM
jgi:hypothetical protein